MNDSLQKASSLRSEGARSGGPEKQMLGFIYIAEHMLSHPEDVALQPAINQVSGACKRSTHAHGRFR